MPTTRAARAAAARAARCLTEALPVDALGLVLYQLPLAHDIAAVAPTCHVLDDAAKLALKLRPFSGEVVTLGGHAYAVMAVAAAPDGRVITGSDDGGLNVWRDGVCEHSISQGSGELRGVAGLGGARFVSVSLNRTVEWTLDGNKVYTRPFMMPGYIAGVATLPDGLHFVVAHNDHVGGKGEVRLYHVDGTLVHTFTLGRGTVDAVAVMPDGQHIISGGCLHMQLNVWSVADKSSVRTYRGGPQPLKAVASMPDGKRIISGGIDRTVRVHLLESFLPEKSFKLHDGYISALVALPDNQHALSGASDNTVKLFNVNDGTVLRTFKHHTTNMYGFGEVCCLALLPDGLRFVSGSRDRTARVVYHGLAPIKA